MTASHRARDQRGETLVEILVAVSILALAATALLGALGTVTSASALHRGQATAETAIRSYAEAVKAAGYRDCGAPGSYSAQDVGFVPPPGFDTSTPAVSYWDGSAFGPGCPATAASGPQLQMVTLEVHSCVTGASRPCLPDGRQSETVALTVRSP